MFELDQPVGPNDLDNTFVVELDNGKLKITGYKTDPYGLWKVKFSAGSLPKELQGAWTSRPLAQEAVQFYVDRRGREVTAFAEKTAEIKEKVRQENLKDAVA